MDPSPTALLATAFIACFAVFAILHAVAVRFLHEVHLHDLRIETHRLREDYLKRLEALRRGRSMGVEIVSPGLDQSAGADTIEAEIVEDPGLAKAA